MIGHVRIWRLCSALLVAGLASSIFLLRAQADDVERSLRSQYVGRILVLRGFYQGDKLKYDSGGTVVGSVKAGDWTIDGVVEIEDVKVSNHHVSIFAKRLRLGWLRAAGFSDVRAAQKQQSQEAEMARNLRVEAKLGSDPVTLDDTTSVLRRIFLTSQDRFADLVPDFWRPCVLAAVIGRDSQTYNSCHFSQEFLAVPGVALAADPSQNPVFSSSGTDQTIIQPGRDVTRPKPLKTPDPEFSPEARQAKFQGTVTL
jgi:hypothetical protein